MHAHLVLLVAHAPERIEHGRIGNGSYFRADGGEKACSLPGIFLKFPKNGYCLSGQGHKMRTAHLHAFCKLSRSAAALACRICRLWPDGSMPLDNIRFASSWRSLASLRDTVGYSPPSIALSVKTVGHSPELASTDGNEEKKTAAVEILAGSQVGFQTANTGSARGMGLPAAVGRRYAHMDRNIWGSARLSMQVSEMSYHFSPCGHPHKIFGCKRTNLDFRKPYRKGKTKKRQDV